MRSIILATRRLGTAVALVALLSPAAASAQSDLDAADAQAFLGDWVVSMDSDFGTFTMDLEISDQDGKVAAAIGSPDMGGPMQEVSGIMRSGEGLTLMWELDAQGQIVDAMIILSPDGDNLSTLFTVADGQFSAAGVATRAQS